VGNNPYLNSNNYLNPTKSRLKISKDKSRKISTDFPSRYEMIGVLTAWDHLLQKYFSSWLN
jgi:hypothetical protein